MSREQNLLPCPFCGGAPFDRGFRRWECGGCGANGPAGTRDQATAGWNARPTVSGGEGWEELLTALERKLQKIEATEQFPLSNAPRPEDAICFRGGRPQEIAAEALALIAVVRGGGALPPAAPSSVPGGDEVSFLLARLAEFEGALLDDEVAREFHGHVAPAIARLKSALPTVQAETAVVVRRIEAATKQPATTLSEALWVIAEVQEICQQAPVSTGEQPGMGEGDPPGDCGLDDLGWAVYCAAYDVLRDYGSHPSGDRGLIQAGESRIPIMIAKGASARMAGLAKIENCKRGGDEPQANAPSITLPDDLLSLSEALEPFALISSEGLVTRATGFVTISTQAEYFHRAAEVIRTLAAKQGGKS